VCHRRDHAGAWARGAGRFAHGRVRAR
jgi:hypothetical protein